MIAPGSTKEQTPPGLVPSSGPGLTLVTPPPAIDLATPNLRPRVEEYEDYNFPLVCLAENLSDLEATRIAMENRLRSLEAAGSVPRELAQLMVLRDQLAAVEHDATLALRRAMRAHPLGPWVARSKGVGEKQAARLLAAVGNPYWNSLHDRPRRGPAELWAYCGYHVISTGGPTTSATHDRTAAGRNLPPADSHHPPDDQDPPAVGRDALPGDPGAPDAQMNPVPGQPSAATPTDHLRCEAHGICVEGVAAKRRKGQRSNWNATAKMRAFLVAESCMKSPGGNYRQLYERGRVKYADLPKGHAHNRALRLVAKAVLRDMFLEAKAWHEDHPEQESRR